MSAIGALTLWPERSEVSINFQLTFDSFKADKIINFLRHLHSELGRHAIIVWDRLNAHRTAARYFRENHPDWFTFEFLPGYAPELNPIESCWGHTKNHDMPNYNANDVVELRSEVRRHLERKRRRRKLLASFFACAGLAI